MKSTFTLAADHPGGNIVVEAVDGDRVRVHQDLRDTSEWWFYWNFRVTGAQGRTLAFEFTNKHVFTAGGPCHSADGVNWHWLGRECLEKDTFRYAFAGDESCGWFSFCIPYLGRDLENYLRERPRIETSVLVRSEKGRGVERLTLSSRQGTFKVVLVARMHACESMSNYALEGLMDHWLTDPDGGAWLREHADLQIIPFMDKDGVELGDQGKLRRPHDHNRDYGPQSIWASNRALREQLPGWRGRFVLAIDLHCPWMNWGRNEEIFLVGDPKPWDVPQRRFASILEREQRGELVYRAVNDIPFGEDWNSWAGPMFSKYMNATYPGVCATTLEMPYALAGGKVVTANNTRDVGRDLGRAIAAYVRDLVP